MALTLLFFSLWFHFVRSHTNSCIVFTANLRFAVFLWCWHLEAWLHKKYLYSYDENCRPLLWGNIYIYPVQLKSSLCATTLFMWFSTRSNFTVRDNSLLGNLSLALPLITVILSPVLAVFYFTLLIHKYSFPVTFPTAHFY